MAGQLDPGAFMNMLTGNTGSGMAQFPPAPALQRPQPTGLLGLLSGIMGQQQPVTPAQQLTMPQEAQTPKRGFAKLFDPDVALPIAGALLGGKGDAANFGAAFTAAGPALKRNQTLEYIQQNNPELAKLVEFGLEPKDALGLLMEERKAQMAGRKAPQVETFYNEAGQSYKAAWDETKGEWTPIGGAKGDEGFEITTADGTTIRQGQFGNQDAKNTANRILVEQDAAKAASNLKQTVGMLRKANANTGYSGPGAGIIGGADDIAEQFGHGDIIPGSAGARATMRSGGLEVALAQVEKTKGAISNAEMSLFMAAAPGMQQTPQGNAALLDILDAVADRQFMRVEQAEIWRRDHGNLDGFEAAWGEYVAANPLVAEDGQGGITLAGKPGGAGGNVNTTSTGARWRVK